MSKRAKIVCTVGPASGEKKILVPLIRNGMDVARLNFSHGTHDTHRHYMKNIREAARSLKKPVAILQDLQGIKIRVGKVKGGAIGLIKGQDLLMKAGQQLSTESVLYISYSRLTTDVQKGHRVLLDDGLIQLQVQGRASGGLRARVLEGGTLTDRKGVNLPDSQIKLPALTRKDRLDLDLGIEAGVDYVAVSFVRNAGDVHKVRNYITRKGASIPIIAKIEKPEALGQIESILEAADGIMVARGDLGVEMNPEEVPVLQKKLIRLANQSGKIVITATQMLESMTGHLRPTRAEATDVANAVLDGSDALMLSAETSIGKYPLEALRMMGRIIEHTEKNLGSGEKAGGGPFRIVDDPYAVADAAARAAADVGAKAIAAFTDSGYTARLVSKFRPGVPILAFTTTEAVQRRLSLLWGVTGLRMKPLPHTDRMILEVEQSLRAKRHVKKGDRIVIIASMPLTVKGRTNFMKIHRIGDGS